MNRSSVFLIGLCASLSLLCGCTKSDSGDQGGTSGASGDDATTKCGVVVNGQLENPVNLGDGTFVRVTDILSNNLVVVAEDGNSSKVSVVKIQGIASGGSAVQNQGAINQIRSLSSGGVYFFKASSNCQISLDGQNATVGSLVTPSGVNVAESLVQNSLSSVDTNDTCSGNLVGSCLASLSNDANGDLPVFGSAACGFLWKPTSDSDGNAVVLVDACDVRVFVNGEEFRQAGAGNGRCTTARGSKSGCAYGSATIEVYDETTGAPYEFENGQTKLVVPGCTRFELPCTG